MDELKAVGAFTNLGAFAIIVYLIVWLTRNLPVWLDKWNATRIEVEKIKVENTRLVIESQTAARAEYATLAQYEREMCKEQFHSVHSRLDAQAAAVQSIVASHDGMRREINEACDATHRELTAKLDAQAAASQEQMERLRVIDHTTRDLAQSRAMADAVSRQKRAPKTQGEEP